MGAHSRVTRSWAFESRGTWTPARGARPVADALRSRSATHVNALSLSLSEHLDSIYTLDACSFIIFTLDHPPYQLCTIPQTWLDMTASELIPVSPRRTAWIHLRWIQAWLLHSALAALRVLSETVQQAPLMDSCRPFACLVPLRKAYLHTADIFLQEHRVRGTSRESSSRMSCLNCSTAQYRPP